MSEQEEKGFFNNIIDSLVSGYEKLIKIFKKHGILYSILLMVIFIAFWTLIINPIRIDRIIENQLEKQQEQQIEKIREETEQNIQRREKANFFVADLMVKTMDKFKEIDRMLLIEKHNGTSNINGVDFLYSSATYELVNDTITHPVYLYEDLQKQTNINLFGNMVQTLKHSDYLFFSDLSKEKSNQYRLLRKLNIGGDEQAIVFSFKDQKHRPIILLVISGENLPVEEIVDYINQFKTQIEELLIES